MATFTATVRGYGCDNPVSTTSQTEVQEARSVMFEFRDTSCIDNTYDIGGGPNSASVRNFLFAGAGFECFCPPLPPSPPPRARLAQAPAGLDSFG